MRVGILGTANIAKKNAKAIHASKLAQLLFVASRDPERAAKWAAEHCAFAGSVKTGTYDDLIACSEVDAVYVPLPTTMHKDWVPKIARAKKHIMLEKPVAVNASEFAEMLRVCEAEGVKIMDGTMFMHHVRFKRLLEELLDSSHANYVGEPRRITSAFSFPGDEGFFSTNIRVKKDGDPLGCVGDLGWYNVRLALAVFGWKMPTSVWALQSKATDEGVPVDVTCDVYFGEDKSKVLSLHCSFRNTLRQWFEIETTKEKLVRCEDFVLPTREEGAMLSVSSGTLDAQVPVEYASSACCQEAEMWDALATEARSEAGGQSAFWREAALKTQAVLDAIMESCAKGNVEVPVKLPNL